MDNRYRVVDSSGMLVFATDDYSTAIAIAREENLKLVEKFPPKKIGKRTIWHRVKVLRSIDKKQQLSLFR